MTDGQWFAFVILPIGIAMAAWLGVRVFEWHDDRRRARERGDRAG